MTSMKRSLLLLLLLALTALPSTAAAGVSCRNRIYNDWYKDGKIASTYPISCYRDAIANVRGGDQVYSSLVDDIRAALQAAIARRSGTTHVPAQVGKGLPRPAKAPKDVLVGVGRERQKREPRPASADGRTTPIAVAPVADTSGGSGIPVPLLVLGGLALALAAAGALGMVVRNRRG